MTLQKILFSIVPLICLASVFFAYLIISHWERRESKSLKTFKKIFIGYVASYIFLVVGIQLFNWFLNWRLYSYDLDGNLMFSDREATEAQITYQRSVIQDLGRNLSPVWGLIFSLLASFLAVMLNSIWPRKQAFITLLGKLTRVFRKK